MGTPFVGRFQNVTNATVRSEEKESKKEEVFGVQRHV